MEVRVKKGWPVWVRYGKKTYRVQRQVDYWIAQGHWWSGEEKRVYFRLYTDRGTIDIYRSTGPASRPAGRPRVYSENHSSGHVAGHTKGDPEEQWCFSKLFD